MNAKNQIVRVVDPELNLSYSLYGIAGERGYRVVGISNSGIDVKREGIVLTLARERYYQPNDSYWFIERFLNPTTIRTLFTYTPCNDVVPKLEIPPKDVVEYREVPLEFRLFDPWDVSLLDRSIVSLCISGPTIRKGSDISLYGIAGEKGCRSVGLAPPNIDVKKNGVVLREARVREFKPLMAYYDPFNFLKPKVIRDLFIHGDHSDVIHLLEVEPGAIEDYLEVPLGIRLFDPFYKEVMTTTVACIATRE